MLPQYNKGGKKAIRQGGISRGIQGVGRWGMAPSGSTGFTRMRRMEVDSLKEWKIGMARTGGVCPDFRSL
jgi:hypothetical protein